MEKVTWVLLLAGLPALEANDFFDKDSPFYYDWESIRLSGMICAGIMCLIGILLILSNKCRCKSRQKHNRIDENAEPFITPGSATNC
ncbi:PREDICTED: FXYD domain-containing ion transport regulator 4-like [Elephantulus edwardii]|uniref:FXYD domain-containing ion transport regulator 4-like n=1 Tax=Elephantulus edwardii TaxID=28737 RepID=UPI0003F05B82|nr:PREDICTED: FXYD domain-containing ion transport regulator 4-like [Elephantulus edwardii]